MKKLRFNLKKAKKEKDVEFSWKEYCNRYGMKLSTIMNTDVFGKYKNNNILFEIKNPQYRLDKHYDYCKVVSQCVSYLKQFELGRISLPHFIFIANADQWILLPSFIFLEYLRKPYNWQIAASTGDENLIKDLMMDRRVNVKKHSIHTDEDFDILWQLVENTPVECNTSDINSLFFSCESPDDYKKLLNDDYQNKTIKFLPKREAYLKREEFVMGTWGKNKMTASQVYHTPVFDFCKSHIDVLLSIIGNISNKIIGVYNIEYLDILYLYDLIKNNEVWLITDNKQKIDLAKKVYGETIKIKMLSSKDYIEWKTKMKFDLKLENPPYNPNREIAQGDILWDAFVKKGFELSNDGAYIACVHPNGWRKPENELWPLMSSKQIKYLRILSEKDSRKLFDVGVRVDWYVIQNTKSTEPTIVVDELGEKHLIDLSDKPFLPNFYIEEIYKLVAKNKEDRCEIINDGYYSTSNTDRILREKTDSHNLPVFLSLDSKNELRVCWSNENLGHFGVPKVICSGGRHIYTLLDFEGKYGINSQSFGIPISSIEEGKEIIKAFNSEKFKNIVKATKWSNFQTNIKFFKYLKKNFWKDLIDE